MSEKRRKISVNLDVEALRNVLEYGDFFIGKSGTEWLPLILRPYHAGTDEFGNHWKVSVDIPKARRDAGEKSEPFGRAREWPEYVDPRPAKGSDGL